MQLKKLLLPLAMIGAFNAASAHGLWLGKVNGELTYSFGHSGTDTDAYAPEKITQATGFKADGSKIDVKIERHNTYATAKAEDAAILTGVMDHGYYARDKDGKVMKDKDGKRINKRGDTVEGAASSAKSVMHTVAYLNSRVKPQTVGHILEIVPSVNPATLEKGQELKVQVLLDGKGLAGAKINPNYFGHAEKVETDKDGFASVPVDSDHFNILIVSHKIEDEKNPFEGRRYQASLTFNAKHEHHH